MTKALREGFVSLSELTQQVISSESKKWAREVPPPPLKLLEIWRMLYENSINSFKPMAIPKNSSFYWILIEEFPQPYAQDPFSEALGLLRKEKKVERYVKDSSRFGLSTDEIERTVLPEFLKLAGYKDGKLGKALRGEGVLVRAPNEMEFRLIFTDHPEILRDPQDGVEQGEWLHSPYGQRRSLIALKSKDGALRMVPEEAGFFRSKNLGFRAVIDLSKSA